MRIPVEYLASLFSAGDTERIKIVLRRLAAMRTYMREEEMIADDEKRDVGTGDMDPAAIRRMYEILAIARLSDRFVIPPKRGEIGKDPHKWQGGDGFPVDLGETPDSALNPEFTGATPGLPIHMVPGAKS